MSCSMFRYVSLALAILLVAACSSDTPTTPTTPTPDPITETFSGTLNPNGGSTHTFTASAAGSATATLSAVGPDDTITIGLSMGTWNGGGCNIVLANDTAMQGASIIGTVTQAGQLCLRVYDVGNFTGPVTYEVVVLHP